MAEFLDQVQTDMTPPAPEAVPETPPAAAPDTNGAPASRYAVAGRKGAERIHQLIERGKLYEKEDDLKRGRQRLRQLIEEGKLYEQEHGLSTIRRRKRGVPASPQQVVRRLLDTLVRVAKPAYRAELLKLVQALE
jgi:hypothetical protein